MTDGSAGCSEGEAAVRGADLKGREGFTEFGEVFGELSMIGEEKRRDFAYAMEDSTACVLTSDEMSKLMKDHSSISMFFMKVMGSRVLEMEILPSSDGWVTLVWEAT